MPDKFKSFDQVAGLVDSLKMSLLSDKSKYLSDSSTGRLQAYQYDVLSSVLNVFKSYPLDLEIEQALINWSAEQTGRITNAYYVIDWDKLYFITQANVDLHSGLVSSILNFRRYINNVFVNEKILSPEEQERREDLIKIVKESMGEFFEEN